MMSNEDELNLLIPFDDRDCKHLNGLIFPIELSEDDFKDLNIKRLSDNRRRRVRYTFHGLRGYFKVNSFLPRNKRMPVLILDISSKGAFIECDNNLKLNSKGELILEFGLATTFVVPTRVVRVNGRDYGLLFDAYHHELSDYLLNSGRSFMIRGG